MPLSGNRLFTLRFVFNNVDGTMTTLGVNYNPFSNAWQYASGVAVAPKDYKDVRIYGYYAYNGNTAYFDGFQMYKEEFGESFRYDTNGNVISTTDLAKQNSTFQYNSSNDLVKALDPKGNSFTYSYDANHNVLSGVSSENVKYSFTYDAYGNPRSTEIGKGLLAYYSFDNSTLNDDSGNGSNGVNHGATFVTGKKGKAISFDGVDDWAELTDIPVPGSFSLSMWVNPHKTDSGQAFVSKHDAAGENIAIVGYYAAPHVRVRDKYLSTGTKRTGYHHLVVTFEKISSNQTKIKWYEDKALKSEYILDNVIGTTTGKPWSLGQEWDGAALSDYMDGDLDELAIFSTVLSDGDISKLYTDISINPAEYGKNIKTTATYTNNGNYMTTMTDSSGSTVEYNWDETKGILNAITDPKDKVTSYSYDNSTDALTNVSKQVGANTVTNTYGYNNDRLETITHNGFSYTNSYDSLGNNTATKVGGSSLVTNSYESRTSKLLETTYGNGQKMQYGYDLLDRVNSIKYNNSTRYEYDFDASGNLAYTNDLINQVKTRYYYDLSDRLTKITDDKGNSTEFTFDADSNNTSVVEKINNQNYQTDYSYDKDGRQKVVTLGGNQYDTVEYWYDSLGRLFSYEPISYEFSTNYKYKDGQNGGTTAQIEEVDNNGSKITYQYDQSGNIITITENGKNISYEYDELNQLTRENNEVTAKTTVYAYDVGGNIASKTEYAYTTGTLGTPTATIPYSYGDSTWKDKLTAYNDKAITYDAIGNPTTYNGYTYSWEEGRNLTGITGNGINATYKYNDSGIRTEKTVGGVTTTYHLVGDKVTFEKTGPDEIYYSYDSNDQLLALKLNGVQYYYVRNGQSDIIGIVNGSGTPVVSYSYDTWGKLISITGSLASTVGEKNPYRYRGYRYDTETGLYYLQSRYYNPEWSRFVNADVIMGEEGELLSHNVFTYCHNNPVINKDDSGYWLDTALDVASLAYSVAKFVKNPTKANAKAIGFDVICILLPGVSVVGIKALSKLGVVKSIAYKLKNVGKARLLKIFSKGAGKPTQIHHFLSNKNSKFTKSFESITKKYDLDLDGGWNKAAMPHQGRHPNAYHNYMLEQIIKFDKIANGDTSKFLKLFNGLKNKVMKNPDMVTKKYWN